MKTNSNDASQSRSVAYQANLPVKWEVLTGSSDASQRLAASARNEELLSALLVLDEAPAEPDDEPSSEQWLRLDAKLNLIVSLLSEFVAQQKGLPPAMPVNVSLNRLEIGPIGLASMPENGAALLLDLYLSPQLPRSLKLTGRVEAIEQVLDQGGMFTLHLDSLAESTQNLLERYVFRQHRRAVAQARAADSS